MMLCASILSNKSLIEEATKCWTTFDDAQAKTKGSCPIHESKYPHPKKMFNPRPRGPHGPIIPELPRSRPWCLLYPEPKFHADRTILRWDILNRTKKQTKNKSKLNITPNATLCGEVQTSNIKPTKCSLIYQAIPKKLVKVDKLQTMFKGAEGTKIYSVRRTAIRLRRSAYVELLKPGSLSVKRRWTRSSASIYCFRHGDQTTKLLSTSGLAWVQELLSHIYWWLYRR